MREKIIAILKDSSTKALSVTEIKTQLNSTKGFDKTLSLLEKEGVIFQTKNGKYVLSESFNFEVAMIIKASQRGLIASVGKDEDKQTYNIPTDASLGAMFQDKVLISHQGHTAGVIKILEPYAGNIVGDVVKGRHSLFVRPLEASYPLIDLKIGATKNVQDGHRVVVRIISRLPVLLGEVVKVLGHKNDPKVDILSLAYQANVPVHFSEEIMDYVSNDLESEVSDSELEGRTDLTNRLIVTIDGKDAKDLDDAIEVHKNPDGTYYLGVHIADVSHYVPKFGIIDREAFKRGTSIYLTDYVIPMLPHALSNGICSLNPDVIRLTMTCEMTINQSGEVIDYDIYESYIKSSHRLNYDDVNDYFNKKHEYPENLGTMLDEALELSRILQAAKVKRGALELDVKEAKIVVDGTGFPIDVVLRTRDDAEKLIEDFMVVANETVASHIYWQGLPFVYRVHDKPKQAKFQTFCNLIEPLGYKIKGERNGVHPLELQSLLNRVKDQDIRDVISTLMLRSLAKAVYSVDNIGHFGLGSDCYTHFTSPIRRYPDLMVHRLLKQYDVKKPKKIDELSDELEYQCEQASFCERRAVDLERSVDDMKKAEYMELRVGNTYTGKVTGMLTSGIFVELPNTIDGMIRFEDMDDDFYTFDEKRMIVIGEGSKKIIKLGDKVLVEVKAASKETRRVDFFYIKKL